MPPKRQFLFPTLVFSHKQVKNSLEKNVSMIWLNLDSPGNNRIYLIDTTFISSHISSLFLGSFPQLVHNE